MTLRALLRRARPGWPAGACASVVLAIATGACGGQADESTTAAGAPVPSSGCAGTASTTSGTVTLRHDGMSRSYDIVVPPARAGGPMPLVLGYHGFGGSPLEQSTAGLADRALADGFVAVFPQGSTLAGSSSAYFDLETVDEPSLADDVGFTEALLDDVEADLCIDRARIYAMGMSNGGMFVSTLACELGDRIAAVAPVAGVHLLPGCGGREVPIIVTHGTADPLVPFAASDVGKLDASGLFERTAGGSAQFRMFEKVFAIPVTSWVEAWATHNGCRLDAPEVTTVRSSVERTAYTGCDDGGDVVLQAVEGGGHEWPTPPTLDTIARALAFFDDHPLPRDALGS
jgi:polyhydroxybutyrate depolymerase